jgi:peptidoglycan/LPS O-acetylase OafA/YrhL
MAILGRYSYGIYLSHPLIIEGPQAVAHGPLHMGPSMGLDVFIIVAGVSGRFGIALLLDRSKCTSWPNGQA